MFQWLQKKKNSCTHSWTVHREIIFDQQNHLSQIFKSSYNFSCANKVFFTKVGMIFFPRILLSWSWSFVTFLKEFQAIIYKWDINSFSNVVTSNRDKCLRTEYTNELGIVKCQFLWTQLFNWKVFFHEKSSHLRCVSLDGVIVSGDMRLRNR